MFARFDLDRSITPTSLKSGELDDATLWQRFKSGNDLAFSILYKKYVQRLFNYGMHTCYDKILVVDSLQELFTQLWDRRSQLTDVAIVQAYLYKSFRRLLLNRLEQNRRRRLFFTDEDMRSFAILNSYEDDIISEEAAAERGRRLKKAIASLSKRQREVIFLKFYNEMSYSDVATVMDIGLDSVYNLMNKAIETLRNSLSRQL